MTSIRKRRWTTPGGDERIRWLVDFKDQTGKRRAKQFQRKKDAEQWRMSLVSAPGPDGRALGVQPITVAAAAKIWLDRLWREDLETTTIASYEQHVRLHIVPLCGSLELSALTGPVAEGLRDQFMEKLSRAMAIRVLRSLTSVVHEAKRKGFITQNPCVGLKIRRAARRRRVIIPTKDELRSILHHASISSDPMAMPLLTLLLFAGLRASELRGLCWHHLDLQRGTVTVSQRADSRNVIAAPKSDAGFRNVPLPPLALRALERWQAQCPKSFLHLVFPSVGRRVMSHAYMSNNILEPVLIAAGLSQKSSKKGNFADIRYTLHTFRHAAASLWVEQHVSPKRIQYWMGHSSIQVTFDTYMHLFMQSDRDASIAAAVEIELTRPFGLPPT